MDIILREDISNLGFKDEIVSVKSGYARNFLVPKGMASIATPSARKVLAENLRQRAGKDAKLKLEAEKLAEILSNATIKVGAKAGDQGKIFGSVNTIQLAESIAKIGHQVDRKYLKIKGDAIKQLGTYEADARLHKEVTVTFKFEVIEE